MEEVCDGVAVYNGISGTFYSKSGETQELSGMDVLGGKYPVAYHGTMRIGDNNLALTNYNVYGEFKTQFGATHESTKAELDKMDLVSVGSVYSIVTTNKGAIDWKDIEKDYDKMVSTNSFKEIEYIDSALLVGSDYTTIAVASDDVKMLIDMYSVSNSEGVKDALMLWLARGKAVDMLLDGDVDYVVEEGVYYQEGRVNTLYVRMYTSVADAEKIKESMGITK